MITAKIVASALKNIERAMTYAEKVTYPYLMLLGEKDVLVNNEAARRWHDRTSSQSKEIKFIPGSYHELSKEPNNSVMFESILKFAIKRQSEGIKPFGTLQVASISFAKQVSILRKPRFWILSFLLYVVIGVLIAVMRGKKDLFFSWPALLVLAKRLK